MFDYICCFERSRFLSASMVLQKNCPRLAEKLGRAWVSQKGVIHCTLSKQASNASWREQFYQVRPCDMAVNQNYWLHICWNYIEKHEISGRTSIAQTDLKIGFKRCTAPHKRVLLAKIALSTTLQLPSWFVFGILDQNNDDGDLRSWHLGIGWQP